MTVRGVRPALLAVALTVLMGSSGGVAQSPDPGVVDQTDRVAQIMAGMSLRQKVGQLLMSRIYGARAETPRKRHIASNRRYLGVDDAMELMQRYHVGSVLYYGWAGNLGDAAQVARLSNGIQSAAAEAGDVAVLISTDQEGGMVRRLGPPAVLLPSAMGIGATHDPTLARSAARVTGEELRSVGIHQNLAPVADVNADPGNPVIGIRAFGSRPELVAQMVDAQVAGLQDDAGVAATVKHFPGHGDTDIDSHVGLPVIRNSRAHWWAVDAPPFEAAIEAGSEVVMTAHVVVPTLDSSRRPATLSRPILTGVLRERLGHDGLIMTDSLTMAAVRKRFRDKRLPVMALKAGADVLADPLHLPTAFGAVISAVQDGELSEDRIDQSVERILRLKERLGLLDESLVDEGAVAVRLGSVEHREVSRAVADAGITVLRNRASSLPLERGWSVLLTGWNDSGVRQVPARMRSAGFDVTTRWTRSQPTKAQTKAVLKAARQHDVSIVFTGFVRAFPRQRDLVQRLLANGGRVIVVYAWSPYDATWFSSAPTQIATYGTVPVSMRSLAKLLSGEIGATGRLPVRIPKLGRPASVLFPVGHGVITAAREP